MTKQLLIFRHAKSSWSSGVADDFSRPLNNRGRHAARLMGRALREMDSLPECIYLSSSVRTSQTCELFLRAAELSDTPLHASRDLYHAGLGDLLTTVGEFDEQYQRVMLIGHNPGLETLLLHLCPDVPVMPNGKLLTTANLAVVSLGSESWGSFGEVSLLKLLRPKELAG